MSIEQNATLLEAAHLTKEFRTAHGVVHAVSDVSLTIQRGETLALVGESGCGKSTLGRLLLRLIEPTSGTVVMDGTEVTALKREELRKFRRKMQLIFQDPYSSIDPRMTIRKIIAEPLKAFSVPKKEQEAIILDLVEKTGIRPEYLERYPHQFSGGQRQRVGIARALALNPELVVCDEPVSALDVSIQAQTLNLLHDLQQKMGLTYLFISHDLAVVNYISDRVCVMFLGKICELGPKEQIYFHPRHPYTKFLLSATPEPDPRKRKEDQDLLMGDLPSPVNPPSGCRFRTQCPYARELCAAEEPGLREVDGRQCACHFPLV
ncbi:MAG: ATP-binding cassette domain-containing protein [Lachnospiraceae bacterium]|nr:ATP-binding cassette domain-containing protein [Lachnospiraceae bacterium]